MQTYPFAEDLTMKGYSSKKRTNDSLHRSSNAPLQPTGIGDSLQTLPSHQPTHALSWQGYPGLFFEPIQFHLQASNLTIQPLRVLMLRQRLWPTLPFKQLPRLIQYRLRSMLRALAIAAFRGCACAIASHRGVSTLAPVSAEL